MAEPADPASAPRETREALLARFRQRAGAALLASYGNAIDPVLALPPERAQALTCLYLLEKAAYEICYESAYRPERLPVPIHGLAETARAALLAAAVDHDEGPAP
ncbi:alpha-glucosidase [Bordetella pertussis]|nr:alpha-glucosidase [Bordetella pertussis]